MTKLSNDAKGALSVGVVALVYLIEGRSLDFGSARMPAEGFMPTVMAVGLLICCAVLFVREWFTGEREEAKPGQADMRKVACLMTALIIYPLLLPYLGFIVSTVGLLWVSFRIFNYRNGLCSAVAAVIVTLLAYGVFEKGLSVLFPRGFWG